MSQTEISLALQGGGAHGAFTWGVLDRLLDEPGLTIDGVSGTSAGAMNACVLAQGLLDGAEAAKSELATFWRRISELGAAVFNPYQSTPFHAMARAWNLDWAPTSLWLETLTQFVSPYQMNPLDHNPLRDLLQDQLDFSRLRQADAVKLFVCATNLKTNQMKIFGNAELSTEALLASACLPQLHRAVEVDGAYYWDGGFIGNPVLKPLVRQCAARDIILVQINPMRRHELPLTARDITDRLNEITMNAALMRELDMIATISRMVEEGVIQSSRYHAIRLHQVADPEMMAELGFTSKSNTAWAFLTYLRDAGRATAERWLTDNRAKLGQKSTLDLDAIQA